MTEQTDVPTDVVVIERDFDAPPEVVWRMWTDSQEFAAWYGPPGATIPTAVRRLRRSSRTSPAISGYCTLTATSLPPASVARCTWASEAAAMGVGSNVSKSSPVRRPSSSVITCSITSTGRGGTRSWSFDRCAT